MLVLSPLPFAAEAFAAAAATATSAATLWTASDWIPLSLLLPPLLLQMLLHTSVGQSRTAHPESYHGLINAIAFRWVAQVHVKSVYDDAHRANVLGRDLASSAAATSATKDARVLPDIAKDASCVLHCNFA
jgi:hypothetical protein